MRNKSQKQNLLWRFFSKKNSTPDESSLPDIKNLNTEQIEKMLYDQQSIIQKQKSIIETLTESNNSYHNIYKDAPFAYFLINENGTILDSNNTGEKLLGINDKSKTNILKFIPHDLHPYFTGAKNNGYSQDMLPDEIQIINCPSTPTFVKAIIHLCADNSRKVFMRDETQHHLASEELAEYQNNLETIISERTAGLLAMNELLIKEIDEKQMAKEALARSEKRYRMLLDSANNIIISLDRSGKITLFNPYAQKFFGYSEEEIIGKTPFGTIVPKTDKSGNNLSDMMQDLVDNPEKYDVNENENILRNGERVWISWTNKGIYNENGELQEIISIGTDLTRQKRMLEAIQYNRENMSALLNSPAGPVILLDRNGVIHEINDHGAHILGQSRESLLGSNLFRINNSLKKKSDIFKEVLDTGRSCNFEFISNNESFDIYLYPVRDKTTEIDRIAMFSFNITDIDKYKTIAHESEEKYRQLVESVNSIIIRVGPDGTINYINEFGLNFFGYSDVELIGRNVIGTIVPDSIPVDMDLVENIQQVLSSPENHIYHENENILKDGTRVWVSWANRPIYDSSGNLIEVMGVGTDITSLKKAENDLIRSQEMANSLLNAIPDRIILVSIDGIILTINSKASEAIGKKPSELIGSKLSDIFNRKEYHDKLNKIQHVASTGKTIINEEVENDRIYQTILSPVPDIDNTTRKVMIFFHDITEIINIENTIAKKMEFEKLRIGEAIHGDLGQYLAAIGFLSRAIHNRCHGINPETDRIIDELCTQSSEARQRARSLAHGQFSIDLTLSNFNVIINNLCSSVENVYGIKCSIINESFTPSPSETYAVYSIIQEGILNSVTHGNVNKIDIQLISNTKWRGIKIIDNGRGFPDDIDDKYGMGLNLIKSRAESINGTFCFCNNEDSGITLSVELPLN